METWQLRVYSGTVLDPHNDVVDAWADSVPLSGCLFDPGVSVEPGGGPRTVTTPSLYVSRRTVGSKDILIGRGHTWQVDGEVADWGPGLPTIVPLKRVEG